MDGSISSADNRRRLHPRWTKLVVATIIMSVASAAYLTHVADQRDDGNRALIDDVIRPLSPPPARLVVCKGSMNAACARRTAERIGTTVAWLEEPAGFQLEWMFATADPVIPEGGVIATQYLVASESSGMLEVLTSVPPLPTSAPPSQSRLVSDGTDRGTMWFDERLGVASIVWTHDGVEYLITAQPRPWDPSAVVDVWRTIRYASPKNSRERSRDPDQSRSGSSESQGVR